MKKSILSIIAVCGSLLLSTAFAQHVDHQRRGEQPGHGSQDDQVEPQLRAHPELKPYIQRYGWKRAVQGSACTSQGAPIANDGKNPYHCRDYKAGDGSLWRIQFNGHEGNKVDRVYALRNGALKTMLEVKNNTVVADNTGVTQPSADATSPNVAQKGNPADKIKEINKMPL